MPCSEANPDIVEELDPESSVAQEPFHSEITNTNLDSAAGLQQALEVDSQSETDSAYGTSLHSELASLTSSITRGIWENGRRYHSYGRWQYAFPNDGAEIDRLDAQHAMHVHLLGDRLFWAPIQSDPSKVLDLGTGTGIWAIDFADMFPSAEVIGTDLSAIQPSWIPPNLRFEIDDAESEWAWQEESFDFIHNRNFVCAIRDWPKLIRQCYKFLKPGAWLELQEKHPWLLSDDGTLTDDSALARGSRMFFEAGIKFGTDLGSARLLKSLMEDAGFEQVQEHILKLPLGPWAKDPRLKQCGWLEMINMVEGVDAMTKMLFTRALGWSPEEVEVFLADVRTEARSKHIHSYYHFYIVFGRKPSRA